jgi:hypothetical protein
MYGSAVAGIWHGRRATWPQRKPGRAPGGRPAMHHVCANTAGLHAPRPGGGNVNGFGMGNVPLWSLAIRVFCFCSLTLTHTHTRTHTHKHTYIQNQSAFLGPRLTPRGGGVGGPKPASRSSTKLESGVPWPTYARHRHHARRPAPLAAPLSSPCAPEQGVAQNVIDRSVGTLESCPVTCSTLAAGLCAVEMPPTDPQ